MNWSELWTVVSGANKFSTAFSHVWLAIVFFRVLVFALAVQQVRGDEDRDFMCNTDEPGCSTVCYDAIVPFSHLRLWAMQLIFVTCPSLMVVAHVKYRLRKDKAYIARHGTRLYNNPGKKRGALWWTYLVSLLFKITFDAGFLYLLQYIYNGYEVPRLSKCSLAPCPITVDCFISRPTEKKIFIFFMVVSSAFSIFTCVCEIIYLVCKRIMKIISWMNERKRINAIIELNSMIVEAKQRA
uniref:gap junction beta-4 protein-like n=1 Tax=Doryrhamphus excisus TaxID=161450 RepID=UPI0025AEB973|nr:gap junction beta-4 protein-like [Doryrhamphus excisus]